MMSTVGKDLEGAGDNLYSRRGSEENYEKPESRM
jgi:hypothetical protein